MLRQVPCPWGPSCSWPAVSSLSPSASTTITKSAGNPRKCSGLRPAWAWAWAKVAGGFSPCGLQAGRVYIPSFPPRHSLETAGTSWASKRTSQVGASAPALTPYSNAPLSWLSWLADLDSYCQEVECWDLAESRPALLPGNPFLSGRLHPPVSAEQWVLVPLSRNLKPGSTYVWNPHTPNTHTHPVPIGL